MTTTRFDGDFRRMPAEHRRRFRDQMPAFSAACDASVSDPGGFRWPQSLRVRRLVSAPGIWELTWSFTGPDGRATFEFTSVDGRPAVRWRRIGDHSVFQQL